MSTNEKLPAETGSRKRTFAFGCLGVIGMTILIGLVVSALDSGSDDNDDNAAAESDQSATSEPEPTAAPDEPVITDAHIDETIAFMSDEPDVSETSISVDGDEVTIAVIVDAAIDENRAREIIDSAVRWLASQAAQSSDAIDGPSNDSLGGIWNHYTLQVGAGPQPDEFYARGAKTPNNPQISWD